MSFSKENKCIFMLCLTVILIFSAIIYNPAQKKINNMTDFTCKSKVQIIRGNYTLKAVIDIKVIDGDGSLYIDGFVRGEDNNEHSIQRTIIFKAEKYKSSPVWHSNKIIPTHLDDVDDAMIVKLLPTFYTTTPITVTNISLITLPNNSSLIMKSHLPYLYCLK